jgi:PAS domain S-box-containing protein
MKTADSIKEVTTLRGKAEELLKNKAIEKPSIQSDEELLMLMHELEVHQLGLALQSEELVMLKSELREINRQNNELYDDAPVAYFTISRAGEIKRLNKAAASMLDQDIIELQNNYIHRFINEETRWIFDHYVSELFKTRQKLYCEIVFDSGRQIFTELVGNLTSSGDCLLAAVEVTGTRVLESARRTLAHFRKLCDYSDEAFYIVSGEEFEYVNPAFTAITGYTLEELKEGRKGPAILSDEWGGYVLIPGQQHHYQTQIQTRNGKTTKVEIYVFPGHHMDLRIGKIKKVESPEKALAHLTLKFKQKFLTRMSHEIRTPLTGIIGMTELIKNTRLDRNQLDLVDTLKSSVESLFEVITQILDYSAIESGKIKLRPTTFLSSSLAYHAERLFNGICKNDEIIFESYTDPFLPKRIQADEHRILQVVNNLISNSVKFTDSGKINVDIRLEKWIDPHTLVVGVAVKDTGRGISSEVLSAIFQPFEQFSHCESFSGNGLGLSICKELASLLGGQITVESVEGKGSSFYFSFIARMDEVEEIPEKVRLPRIPQDKKLKILFAEDKQVNQKVVGLLLESMGHEVVFVSDGQQAIDILATQKFDLVLMDIQMPQMDGITATQEIRRRYKKLPPIVALTANAIEGDREKYLRFGLDEYLAKPVKGQDLKRVIDQLVYKQY